MRARARAASTDLFGDVKPVAAHASHYLPHTSVELLCVHAGARPAVTYVHIAPQIIADELRYRGQHGTAVDGRVDLSRWEQHAMTGPKKLTHQCLLSPFWERVKMGSFGNSIIVLIGLR